MFSIAMALAWIFATINALEKLITIYTGHTIHTGHTILSGQEPDSIARGSNPNTSCQHIKVSLSKTLIALTGKFPSPHEYRYLGLDTQTMGVLIALAFCCHQGPLLPKSTNYKSCSNLHLGCYLSQL